MAVFCSYLISRFPGKLLRYCLSDFQTVPVVPIIPGITFVFTAHIHTIYSPHPRNLQPTSTQFTAHIHTIYSPHPHNFYCALFIFYDPLSPSPDHNSLPSTPLPLSHITLSVYCQQQYCQVALYTLPYLHNLYLPATLSNCRDRDSSVGIATDYGLNGPENEYRWERDYSHTSRPALGPTQPPVQ
jgi:hypothetical protein